MRFLWGWGRGRRRRRGWPAWRWPRILEGWSGAGRGFFLKRRAWRGIRIMLRPAGWGDLWLPQWRGGEVRAVSIAPPRDWRAVIVIPGEPLATRTARAVLPESYSRQDAVANVQRVALLTAAFAMQRADVIALAMQDRIHQPFRAEVCPLLPRLLPLAGRTALRGWR